MDLSVGARMDFGAVRRIMRKPSHLGGAERKQYAGFPLPGRQCAGYARGRSARRKQNPKKHFLQQNL
ncbi:hypothetical protein RQM65_03185 [Pricia sp. S334]|uniref:Uncharacterized protein n=1 Tax=Pricia mediterranea TaxID=3076079 RepID=A0ABU3L1Q7_9FLAO|nr:hypothetical protein [Pricia sp. S334]MDT7827654.1 hypothetical protein [Pricia sp. S334]MDT7827669.1 hypothetical protein [Pricia sp. S334]